MARILIIEDAVNLRLLYRLELESEGYEIVDVGSGTEALDTLAREKIDAIVLDLLLPDCFGLQLLDEILLQQRHLPLVINTAYGQFRDNFLTWGADAFVVKSSDLSELKSALKQVTSGRAQNGAQKCSQENALRPAIARKNSHKKSSPSLPATMAQKNYGWKGVLT
jgi:DNA-binding response OmpR family regulator